MDFERVVVINRKVNGDEATAYRFDILKRDENIANVIGMITYRAVDSRGNIIMAVDSKNFCEALKEEGFAIIRKDIDWERSCVELIVGVRDSYWIKRNKKIEELADEVVKYYLDKFDNACALMRSEA